MLIAKLLSVADIVLTTLNAKYIHAAFGLRYLLANLGELQPRACLAEFDINQRPLDIAEVLLARNPKIIGFGIYIWNVEPTTEVIAAIKRVRPDIKIILGGPEVSYETEDQPIVQLADHVITGEADLKFAEVCRVLLERRVSDPARVRTAIHGNTPGRRPALHCPKSSPPNCRTFRKSPCPTIFTPTTTSRIASSTSRRRAAVRSRANFACRRSTFRCGRFRWPNCSNNCSGCSIAA